VTQSEIMRRITDKDMRQLLRKACRSPRVSLVNGRRHVKVVIDGCVACTVSSTPSDWRALKNTRNVLSRKGVIP